MAELTLRMISLSLSLSVSLSLQAAHTFCVSVLYVHVVFDDKHVLNLMCVRACMCLPQIKLIFICIYLYIFLFYAHYRLVSRFTGVHFNMVCMNVHVL